MSSPPLRSASLPDDPLELLAAWVREAEAEESIQYARAMCLSTVSPEGAAQGRFVIVHSIDARGLLFLTDARSPKARGWQTHSTAALTAYWQAPLERQVRIEGTVEPAEAELADQVFHQRPRPSQATPWASRQSEVTTLEKLEAALEAADRRFQDVDPLPRPPHWRGYRLAPRRLEFWLARPRRLHDRFRYTRSGSAWGRVRLAP